MPDRVQMIVRVEAGVRDEARSAAKRQGLTLNQWMARALEAYLAPATQDRPKAYNQKLGQYL